jgi:hypothetical protein
VQRLLVELPGQKQPGLRCIDVLVQKKATRRRMRWRSAGIILRRSTRSSEKSISSTVHVLRIAAR